MKILFKLSRQHSRFSLWYLMFELSLRETARRLNHRLEHPAGRQGLNQARQHHFFFDAGCFMFM